MRPDAVDELASAGARACACAADAARHSDLITSLVADSAQTDEGVSGANGIVNTLQPGAIFAAGSTLGPALARRIAAILAQRGCAPLAMPISGGYIAAAEGTLSLMLGGDEAIIERALPALRTFASTVTRAGDVGVGQVKLAQQWIMSVNIIALMEGLSPGVAGDVDPQVLRQIIHNGLANSAVLRLWNELGPR